MLSQLMTRGGSLISTLTLLQKNPNNYFHPLQYCLKTTLNNKRTFSYSSHSNLAENTGPVESNVVVCNDDEYSMAGLRRDRMPKHAAVCLDGNRRWLDARNQYLTYKPFYHSKWRFAQLCLKWQIPIATSLVWGLGNFTKRGDGANDILLGQFEQFLEENFENFMREGVKVVVKGGIHLLSKSLQDTIKKVEETTKNNTNLVFYVPVCYTGQRDIIEAIKRICEKVKEGAINPQDINEDMISNGLSLPPPPIELFMRTGAGEGREGGETRVGALLTWHVSHTELYFTDVLAPDFSEDVFLAALRSFQKSRRLFAA